MIEIMLGVSAVAFMIVSAWLSMYVLYDTTYSSKVRNFILITLIMSMIIISILSISALNPEEKERVPISPGKKETVIIQTEEVNPDFEFDYKGHHYQVIID